jgi:hypothetical protein
VDEVGTEGTPQRSTDAFASSHDVTELSTEVKDLGLQVKAMDLTLKQVLVWLRGTTDDDGEFVPGLIEQNKRMMRLIRGASRWGLGFLGTIATSAVGLLIINVAHALGWSTK